MQIKREKFTGGAPVRFTDINRVVFFFIEMPAEN